MPGTKTWGKVPLLQQRVGVQSIGLYPCSLFAYSHSSSWLRPPSPFSFPFHFFVVPLGPEFLFPDLPTSLFTAQMAKVLGDFCPVE